ncbi:MAG: hypothetical protein ACHREM_20750 [Polyangiales bacterium]
MSSQHAPSELLTMLVPLATLSVAVVYVPKPKGPETYAHVFLPDLEPIAIPASPRGGGRSQAERTLTALTSGLHQAMELRASHVVLDAGDPHVVKMLRGDFVSRATHNEWDRLQRAIGRASAIGTRVYIAGSDGLVRVGE